jgi:hypothetical protein
MSKTPWTKLEIHQLTKAIEQGKTVREVADHLGRSEPCVRGQLQRLRLSPKPQPKLSKKEATLAELKHADHEEIPKPEFGHLPLSVVDAGGWVRIGLVADTHLCCKEERLSELHNQYDLFVAEGITNVFHAGNPIDGYVARINGESVFSTTIDGQCQYFAENYPSRPSIHTRYITGDDHESWFAPGFNIGKYLQHVCEANGRTDCEYIGHVECDVEIRTPGCNVPTILKIQHPGGGSAYARSYTGQKQVEAFEGGEKPAILVQGHYHVSNYMNDRNIHVISMPGFQDQTIFARKKRLRMEVGGAILEFKVNPADGSITRCRVEFNRYFTRGFYKRYIKSDATLVKGRVIINA